MARIFITGSADGLGQLSAKALIAMGHEVVLHARNKKRANDALDNVPGSKAVFEADLSDISATKKLAEALNQTGPFDAVIHNAGVYQVAAKQIFLVNTLAPYILTCLMEKPKRLVYLSSGMQSSGSAHLEKFDLNNPRINYSDSKLHVLMLCMAIARKWPSVYSNAVDPGWVPTKMGGRGAPDDLQKGYETQVWLASGTDDRTHISGRYFHHQKERPFNKLAQDVTLQERFLMRCEEITGVGFPG